PATHRIQKTCVHLDRSFLCYTFCGAPLRWWEKRPHCLSAVKTISTMVQDERSRSARWYDKSREVPYADSRLDASQAGEIPRFPPSLDHRNPKRLEWRRTPTGVFRRSEPARKRSGAGCRGDRRDRRDTRRRTGRRHSPTGRTSGGTDHVRGGG